MLVGLAPQTPRHVAGAQLLPPTLVVDIGRPERPSRRLASREGARLVVVGVHVHERRDVAALEGGVEIQRQIGVGHELAEEQMGDALRQQAVSRAGEDAVGVDRATLLVAAAPGEGPIGRRVGEGDAGDGAPEMCRVQAREHSAADIDPGELVAVEAGLKVQDRTVGDSAEDRNGQVDRCAVQGLADGDHASLLSTRCGINPEKHRSRSS